MNLSVNECVQCGRSVEVYRKSNICEGCHERILKEEELFEKTRSTWFDWRVADGTISNASGESVL